MRRPSPSFLSILSPIQIHYETEATVIRMGLGDGDGDGFEGSQWVRTIQISARVANG